MFVKIMSADGSFELVDDVKSCHFGKCDQGPSARMTFRDGTTETRPVSAPVFLLSDAGQTVERFHPKQQ